MTSKERAVLNEIVQWFEELRHRDRLESYEHALFIAAADLLWNREQSPMSVEQLLDSDSDEVLSLSPSFIESIRVFAMGGPSQTLPTKVPPAQQAKKHAKQMPQEVSVPPASLAAHFDLQGLPAGAHLGQPKLPTFDSEPAASTETIAQPTSELPTQQMEQEPPTVRDPSRTQALSQLTTLVGQAQWDERDAELSERPGEEH